MSRPVFIHVTELNGDSQAELSNRLTGIFRSNLTRSYYQRNTGRIVDEAFLEFFRIEVNPAHSFVDGLYEIQLYFDSRTIYLEMSDRFYLEKVFETSVTNL